MNNTNSRSLAKPKLFPELSLQNGKKEVVGLVMSGNVKPPAAARVLSTRGLQGAAGQPALFVVAEEDETLQRYSQRGNRCHTTFK